MQTLRQLKHEIAPITMESRHIIGNRAINMMRFGRIWRDFHTHPAIPARPPLTRIAQGFQRAGGGRQPIFIDEEEDREKGKQSGTAASLRPIQGERHASDGDRTRRRSGEYERQVHAGDIKRTSTPAPGAGESAGAAMPRKPRAGGTASANTLGAIPSFSDTQQKWPKPALSRTNIVPACAVRCAPNLPAL
jgi:hypothetical protein